jgi:hypothetical protein
MTGYDRDRFGQAWLDADRNGCDTRNDILGEQLRAVTLESNGCVVAAGSYEDPYTGSRIDYWHGHGALIDIDHVVSLGNAWATGAFGWPIKKRAAFANDPLNLLPTDASANRQKGDGDAATWLPPNTAFRCEYVSRQVAVKAKYDLWVTAPEKAAIQRVLAPCDGQALTRFAPGIRATARTWTGTGMELPVNEDQQLSAGRVLRGGTSTRVTASDSGRHERRSKTRACRRRSDPWTTTCRVSR